MKIVNRQPQQTANVSAEQGTDFKELRRLMLWLAGLILVIFIVVELTVDLTVRHISFETEARLFGAPLWSRLAGVTTNDARLADLQPLLESLVADPSVPPLPYKLTVIENPKPNAFAFPGGTIGVTSGLLDVVHEDIERAFVLAHELGHFHDRAHLRGLGRAIGLSVAFTIVFGGDMGAESVVRIMQHVVERGYSRHQESEADEYGIALVHRVYKRTDGVDRLFQLLKEEGTPPEWTYMFSTHPSPSHRIKELEAFSKTLPNQ
ncbi:MAG: M48 family metallopeptidase [Kiritimatiellae bacterium]|nr:M48 family metallopeptidase [Kiritimatiellia bacterium]